MRLYRKLPFFTKLDLCFSLISFLDFLSLEPLRSNRSNSINNILNNTLKKNRNKKEKGERERSNYTKQKTYKSNNTYNKNGVYAIKLIIDNYSDDNSEGGGQAEVSKETYDSFSVGQEYCID